MATPKSPSLRIPLEVLNISLSNIKSPYDLSSASLVSRMWNRLAFPHLHRAMRVGKLVDLEMLTSRLESEVDQDTLRIGRYLRSLQIDCLGISLCSEHAQVGFTRLMRALDKLTRLEHLIWTGGLPSNVDIFDSFRKSCPKLCMLTLNWWGQDKANPAGEMVKLIFPIVGYERPSRMLDGVINMIEASPGLVELELISDSNKLELSQWHPSALLCNLQNPLDQLRLLRLAGSSAIDLQELVYGSLDGPSLRLFFEQHSHLRGVHFDGKHEHQPDIEFDPALMPRLFPSVESFTGPITLCLALVASSVAKQLMSLTVLLEEHNNPCNFDSDLVDELIGAVTSLSNLQEFVMVDNSELYGPRSDLFDAEVLDKLLTTMPKLVTLNLKQFSFNCVQLQEPLKRVPLLTNLALHIPGIRYASFGKAAQYIENQVYPLTKICPRLRHIQVMCDDGATMHLDISRLPNGSVHINMD
ncbi:hypothetical protein CTheo_7079 [Ceratobasidium theobromae]|uniref:F-box domain-containing protein n=1 Tax=Ceratobasidium theobromae TaxID=1582974 RepID=A0A5N5QDE6_9AGAM|nr:hypothetical protein CTheo_7079 [Ceratobasidium theobromae]